MFSIVFLFWLLTASSAFCVCLFIVYTLFIFYIRRKYSHIPSPKITSFYFGHIPDILRLRKEQRNPALPLTDICQYWFESVGRDTIVIYFFHQPRVFTADPEVVKKISMDSKHEKAAEFLKPLIFLCGKRFLGGSLVTEPNYEKWLPQRKMLDPMFTKKYLQELVPKFNCIVDDHLGRIEKVADGKTAVPLSIFIQNFVLSIVSETLFGSDLDTMCEHAAKHIQVPGRFASGKLKEPLHYILARVNDGIYKSLTSLVPSLMPFYSPFESKEYRDAVNAVRGMARECIEGRLTNSQNGVDTPADVLNQILELPCIHGIGMEELIDHFYNFFGGGFDTTLNMMQFTIILLCQHPEIMSRVMEEVNEVLGSNTELTAEGVKQLEYMDKVLHESLRMYPIVLGVTKSLSCDVKVKDDIMIPAKTTVMLMSSVITRKAEYFEDPEVFNPDRFSPATRPNSFTYFPFGIGHRKCIGKNFALMEAKMFLAKFFQKFIVTLPEDYKLVPIQEGVTYKPRGDLVCTLTNRSN